MTPATASAPTVLVCSYLEDEYVDRIRADAPGEVLYAPELLPTPRYRNDHNGVRPTPDPGQHADWLDLLGQAEICFDFDWMAPGHLYSNAPRLRWVQGTSAGVDGFVKRHRIDADSVTITTAAGVHARPLAEFATASMLHFVRDIPRLQREQRAHHWERHQSGHLAGRTVTIVGLGSIGRQIAAVCTALETNVIGIARPGHRHQELENFSQIYDSPDQALPFTDVLILCCPLTEQTHNLISADLIALLPHHAIVINLARGPVIDQESLTQALGERSIGAAALDVFNEEPLPQESALWDMPNVLISPHSASTVADENELLTDLFLDNLSRYLSGASLRNQYHPQRGY